MGGLKSRQGQDARLRKVKLDTPMSANTSPEANREEIRLALREMRRSYGEKGLETSDLPANPFLLFRQWLHDAANNQYIVEANAMVLSTFPDPSSERVTGGAPISRTVLLKDLEEHSLTFFSNYASRKAHNIESNNRVALLFPWYAMERQVYFAGSVERIDEAESDAYFATRPYGSQIGAWASHQSQPLSSREELEDRYKELCEKFPEGSTVPRPEHWGGFRVTPHLVEFWQGRYSRLHDRILYALNSETEEFSTSSFLQDHSMMNWSITRLNP